MTKAEREVRAECPKATLEIREHSKRRGMRIYVVTHDGVEYAGSGTTACKAWADALVNIG